MGFILIGIIVAALIVFTCGKFLHVKVLFPPILAAFAVIMGLSMGLVYPAAGYEEPRAVSVTELIGVTSVTDPEHVIYLLATGSNSYIYYQVPDTTFAEPNGRPYKGQQLTDDFVTIVEDGIYTANPHLTVYEQKATESFWSFALIPKKEYIFYIPQGTMRVY